jgi:hypothetical protein
VVSPPAARSEAPSRRETGINIDGAV